MSGQTHYVTIHREDDAGLRETRAYWECSCGTSGSAAEHKVDEASDRHIPEGDQRVDRYPAR